MYLEPNDNEFNDDLTNPNEDNKQSENSENSVYPPESECVINYESEEDKESSLLNKKRTRTPDDDLTEKLNQLHLE